MGALNVKILVEAARFLRTTDNPFAETMAEAVEQAARALGGGVAATPRAPGRLALSEHAKARPRAPGGVFLPASPAAPAETTAPAEVTSGPVTISDENVKILLRAGGYKVVKRTTLIVYRTMLSKPGHEWSAGEIGRNCGRPGSTCAHTLRELMKRKIVERISFGLYRAS